MDDLTRKQLDEMMEGITDIATVIIGEHGLQVQARFNTYSNDSNREYTLAEIRIVRPDQEESCCECMNAIASFPESAGSIPTGHDGQIEKLNKPKKH